ncbi:MAG TPA: phosphate acyltransferase PlsX [Myxococcales bacterium]|jgi:glycerol-3-phosphate acyltransferase PlsX
MRLALDAMGGDCAPAAVVEGAVLHARKTPGDTVVLVGDEPRIEAELVRLKAAADPAKRRAVRPLAIEVRHAPQTVGMDEHPATTVRRKRGSSIRVAFDLVARGEADAVVSAGNSGAALAAALFVLGRLPAVDRPAVVTLLPTLAGRYAVLLDSGATVACRPAHLVQFAHLGEAYARRVLGVARPRVALLSNGTEKSKGTDLTRSALEALERSSLNFLGYVEGNDLFADQVDVIVTDGFTGNVVLKATEGAAAALSATLKREIESRSTAKLGAWLSRPAFAAFRKIADWAEVGGAQLVGVDGTALLAHGRSNARAIRNALRAASRAAELQLSAELTEAALKAQALSRSARPTVARESRTEQAP